MAFNSLINKKKSIRGKRQIFFLSKPSAEDGNFWFFAISEYLFSQTKQKKIIV
jgi:hypothetical protein